MGKPRGKSPFGRQRRRQKVGINIHLREIYFVDATGSGSCPMAGFGISGVEPWGCATRELVT
jgi:hypothetical protein